GRPWVGGAMYSSWTSRETALSDGAVSCPWVGMAIGQNVQPAGVGVATIRGPLALPGRGAIRPPPCLAIRSTPTTATARITAPASASLGVELATGLPAPSAEASRARNSGDGD